MVSLRSTAAFALLAFFLALAVPESAGFLSFWTSGSKNETTKITTPATSDGGDDEAGDSGANADGNQRSGGGRDGSGSGSGGGKSVDIPAGKSSNSQSGSTGSRSGSYRKVRKYRSKKLRSSSKSRPSNQTSEQPPAIISPTDGDHGDEKDERDEAVPNTVLEENVINNDKAFAASVFDAHGATSPPKLPADEYTAHKSANEAGTVVLPAAMSAAGDESGGGQQTTMQVQMTRTKDGNIVATVDVPMSPPLVKGNTIIPQASLGGVYPPNPAFLPNGLSPFSSRPNLPPYGYPRMEANPLFPGYNPYVSPWRQNSNFIGPRNEWNPWNLFG